MNSVRGRIHLSEKRFLLPTAVNHAVVHELGHGHFEPRFGGRRAFDGAHCAICNRKQYFANGVDEGAIGSKRHLKSVLSARGEPIFAKKCVILSR